MKRKAVSQRYREKLALDFAIDGLFIRKQSLSNSCMTYGARVYFKKKKDHWKRMRIKRKKDWIHSAEEILDSIDNKMKQAQKNLKYL